MYGIYLKCEKCGKTIGGEDVTPKQQGIPTLSRFDGKNYAHLLPSAAGNIHRQITIYAQNASN